MYLALKRAGVPAELHIYATAAHDFGVRPSDHPCSTWIQSCVPMVTLPGILGGAAGLSAMSTQAATSSSSEIVTEKSIAVQFGGHQSQNRP